MGRYDLLPTYHYQTSSDGIINNPAMLKLRDYAIHGAEGGVGNLNKNIADISKLDTYTFLGGTLKNVVSQTGSFDVTAQYGLYGKKISLLFPYIEAEKEYYLFATAPSAKHQFCYIYGTDNNRPWKFGTKQKITQADLDAPNGLGIYGAEDGSVTHYSGFMIVPSELYDESNKAFEPYMSPGEYNIPITISENLEDASTTTVTSKTIWIKRTELLIEGENISMTKDNLPNISLVGKRNIIAVNTIIPPEEVRWQYYTY